MTNALNQSVQANRPAEIIMVTAGAGAYGRAVRSKGGSSEHDDSELRGQKQAETDLRGFTGGMKRGFGYVLGCFLGISGGAVAGGGGKPGNGHGRRGSGGCNPR